MGGVVWHTQGAGKSLEMICLAGKLMTHPKMNNPTLVVVTDRNDLDGQLHGTFDMAAEVLGEKPVQAESRTELREHLNHRPSGGIIFTTIQKFVPGEDEDTFRTLTERDNVVVLCDEAHRSQYGRRRESMRPERRSTATPSICGRPAECYLRRLYGDADCCEGQGHPRRLWRLLDIYDIEQAVKDEATVPIYYESRLVKLEMDSAVSATLDDEDRRADGRRGRGRACANEEPVGSAGEAGGDRSAH